MNQKRKLYFEKDASIYPISPVYDEKGFSGFLRSDNIIELDMKDGYSFSVEDGYAMLDVLKKISGNQKFPLIVFYAYDNLFSRETRELIARHDLTVADALVGVGTPLIMIANFYLNINRPKRPTKYFSNEPAALEWLKQFKKQSSEAVISQGK
ncbi:MAG: hypothetical protein RL204_1877 [Bacteroidota bacterium]|jgi:hypothetical protein